MILEKIDSPKDLRGLSIKELEILASEIRERIIDVTSKTGGHVGPSLGVVELTLALHYVFDTPKDKLIWDVGHQTYAHKLITGRRDKFHTLRTYKGISGFPKREESIYDVFDTGHSSTSISAALGIVIARDLKGEDYKVIAVIGDGALTAGMAWEALNNAGQLQRDIIIILNDNERSIGESKGALAMYLNRIITGKFYNRLKADVWNLLGALPDNLTYKARRAARKIREGLKNLVVPGGIFEELGFRYIGPLDGHNLKTLIPIFERIRDIKGPVFVHVVTKKGKGYRPAESNPEPFHGIGPFDEITGEKVKDDSPTYSSIFGKTLVDIAKNDRRVIGITAAMALGTGLSEFQRVFPERFFDVGICEQHALTFAAGLALEGFKPVVAIYSTFLQRAYDQLIHDICLQNLPVVLAIDRAGLVGEDGPTHHGPFDLSYLRTIPNIVVMAPKDGAELRDMVYTAVKYDKGPIAIRYPRGSIEGREPAGEFKEIPIGRGEVIKEGRDGCILAIGSVVRIAYNAALKLEKEGIDLCVVNSRFVKPLDRELLSQLSQRFDKFFTIEENVVAGGFGSAILEYFVEKGMGKRVFQIGIRDEFVEHGERGILLKECGLSEEEIIKEIRERW